MDNRYLSRAKRVDNGEWVKGYYVGPMGCTGTRYSIHSIYFASGPRVEIDPATIGQCTGLTDKNGKLIFEGDICKDSLGWVLEVLWDKKNARFLGRHSKPRGDTYICYVGREPSVEVIGNVHDHPVSLQPGVTP